MVPTPEAVPPLSAFAQLRACVGALEAVCEDGNTPRIRDLLFGAGATHAAALAAIILALPFLTPVSLGLMTAPASAVIALCGIGVARNSGSAVLPRRLLDIPIPARAIRVMRAALDRLYRAVLRVSRPRIHPLVDGGSGRVICGLGMVLGAALLAIPIPFLPLTNTFPALGVICIALGWSEQDGLMTLAGFGALAASVLTFAVIAAGIWMAAGGMPLG